MVHARLRHQCSSLNSDLFHINITNESKWQCGSLFKDSIHYIMECPLHQNEHFKVKYKGQIFFQISTFSDSDFSTLIEHGNNFQFTQEFCAKSSGKLICLKPREISFMVIPLYKYSVLTSFVSFLLFWGEKDNHTILFVCVQNGLADGHWTSLRNFTVGNRDLGDRY